MILLFELLSFLHFLPRAQPGHLPDVFFTRFALSLGFPGPVP